MKIAILHSGDMNNLSHGGIDRYIKTLILFFNDNTVTVYGTTRVGEHEIGHAYHKQYCGKPYLFVPISNDSRYPLSFYFMINEFRWIKQLGEYDCIYAQRTEFSVPFLFSKHKKKLIQMIHGSSKYSEIGFGKKLAKIHLLLEKIAIFVARKTFIILNRKEFGVPYYKEKYNKYANRIAYGLNPIDTTIYYPSKSNDERNVLKLPNDKLIMLFSGRIENNPKRILMFPQICAEIIKECPNFLFVVIGDGSDKKILEKCIDKMGLREYFVFPGYIDNPNIISKYNNACDVAINISMFEGTCTSNLEAIACKTPVISTDVGDIHECIFNNENGIIIPNDEDSIVKNVAEAFLSVIVKGVPMNDAYKKYSGENVVKSLIQTIEKLEENS